MGFSPRAPRLRVNLYTEGLPAQKTFGETFGAATGVSAPSYRGGFADGMGFSGPGFERPGLRGVD